MKKLTIGMLFLVMFLSFTQMHAQEGTQQINQQLDQLLENNKISQQDGTWKITSATVSSISGIQHVYYRQVLNGLEVHGTESGVHMLSNGKVIAQDNQFIANASEKALSGNQPSITAIQAVQAAAQQLGYNITGDISVLERSQEISQEAMLSDGGISKSPIPAKLLYTLNDANELILVWDISIEEIAGRNWWNARVDAISGQIVNKDNWMLTCSMEHEHTSEEVLDYNKNLFDMPNYKEASNEEVAGCSNCYEVFALPIESPYFGTRTLEVDPADPIASPFGWHDTDGVGGAEFTDTRGNNVNAFEAGNNQGYRPDGGANNDFQGYPFGEIWVENTNEFEDAAITNLFYWNNIIHDLMYQYGLDEAGGNFQENNYGNGGSGSDSVNANAQIDIFCNATFGTPPDGGNPTMNMFVCNNGFQDGCFDNLVVVHEYGHGVSNRLTGGPNNTGCLGNTEQMGEGWSDYLGAIMTMIPGATGEDPRTVGTYLFGQGPNGGGIRPFPYSTDFAVNPQTYDDIKTAAIPHGIGSVWSSTLWEVTWELIGEHGWDADIYNFTGDINQDAGNVQALALVMEGMKLQPCSPGFVDGRDAIFAADQAIYGGANECLLWDAFARRGLGVSADQGSSNNRGDGTEAFDTPSGVASYTAPQDVCASEPELTGLGGGSPIGGVYSGPGVTDDGNGSTYSFDPAAAGVGVHTISYEVQAGTCSVASTDTDDIEVLAVPDSPATTGVTDFCPGDDVTVTATLVDPANVIRWFDAPTEGNFLFEGTDYTFSPTTSVTVYAQENPPSALSQLVISEVTLETPDRFEIQNVGVAKDYTGYAVAVSEQPYTDINTINGNVNILGAMGQDSVVDFNDDGGAGFWGSNIWWNNDGTGWIIIIDPDGNVVDSLFWNFTAAEIANLNVTINGFNITAADLDWTGDGAILVAECNDSFRRTGESDSAADWTGDCLQEDYGVANDDIGLGFTGCLASRTATEVTAEGIDPEISCPADQLETIAEGTQFTIPDYGALATATDNCTAAPTITQDPAIGTDVGEGTYDITLTATDEAGNDVECTFVLTVDEILDVEAFELDQNIVLYPNPTTGIITLSNKTTTQLSSAVLTDVNGRIIQTFDLSDAGVETTMNVDGLAQGVYFVRIQAENTSLIKRIVKQ